MGDFSAKIAGIFGGEPDVYQTLIDAYHIHQDLILAELYHFEVSNRFEVLKQYEYSEGICRVFIENALAAASSYKLMTLS